MASGCVKLMPVMLDSPEPKLASVGMDRILVIEDDSAIRKVLERFFASEGYDVEVVPDGSAGLEVLRSRPPSALILDPGLSGIDFCREIARLAPGLPFVILSAKAEVADKVVLLEMGADDYVTIPFSPRELLARVRTLIRRSGRVTAEDIFVFGDVVVSWPRMEVTRAGRLVELTAKEFQTLEFMIKNAERVVPREELLNQVWGYQNYPCTRTVDNHILRLRQKLEKDPSNPVHLLTVHGTGYRFSSADVGMLQP
jgi:DNA-binding response OmpR family regulator